MKFVTARDFRTHPSRIWNALSKEKTMTITVNGKPIAMLLSTSSDKYEDSLDILRRVKAEKAVLSMQEHSLLTGLNKLTLDDIEDEIKLTRRENKK